MAAKAGLPLGQVRALCWRDRCGAPSAGETGAVPSAGPHWPLRSPSCRTVPGARRQKPLSLKRREMKSQDVE